MLPTFKLVHNRRMVGSTQVRVKLSLLLDVSTHGLPLAFRHIAAAHLEWASCLSDRCRAEVETNKRLPPSTSETALQQIHVVLMWTRHPLHLPSPSSFSRTLVSPSWSTTCVTVL